MKKILCAPIFAVFAGVIGLQPGCSSNPADLRRSGAGGAADANETPGTGGTGGNPDASLDGARPDASFDGSSDASARPDVRADAGDGPNVDLRTNDGPTDSDEARPFLDAAVEWPNDAPIGNDGRDGSRVDGDNDSGARDGGRPTVVPAPGAVLVKVKANEALQKFEGWGGSVAWWGDRIGGWTADKRNRLLDLIVDPRDGLGYNIFRYNIGGGENPAHNHLPAHRAIPGYQPTRGTWDWNADERQVAVLTRLVSQGQGVIVEAFSNSPPYWMTKSGCVSGNVDGSDNLKDDAYEAFADYLTEVTRHFRDVVGVTFRTLEPLNEPKATWWKANGSQEGCHFEPFSQQKIIKAVCAQLVAKGLVKTTVSASDENSIDDAVSIISGYDASTLSCLSQMNTHSYYGSKRAELRALATAKNKRLWQSESGPLGVTLATDLDAALFMASRIIQDLRELRPNAWLDWQIVDTNTAWSTFNVNDAQQTFTPNKRFYMHAGFSRWIRPGATFVTIDHPDMVSALSADGATLTIVARNGDIAMARSFTYDLTAMAAIGASVAVRRTSKTENLVAAPAIAVKDWSFTATLPPLSVTTFVVSTGP